jgi:adenylate kinase
LKTRLLLRGKDSGRADDANPEIIERRIMEYNSKTAAVATFYDNQNKLKSINGIGSIEEIFTQICLTIDSNK